MAFRLLRSAQASVATSSSAVAASARRAVTIHPAPSQLPHFRLRSGDMMPSIGMGTFTGTRLTQKVPKGTMGQTVNTWIKLGGRLIDCAQNYLNEDEIGDNIAACIEEGVVSRADLFISSKLNNPYHRPEHVRPALEKTLLDLRTDYLDLYLMHWPTAFKYVPFDGTQRGFPDDYEPDQCSKVTGVLWKDYTGPWPPPHLDMGVTIHETWQAMVECWKAGLVANIGVCNFQLTLLHELMCGSDVVPHVLQNESHPYHQQWDQIEFCAKNAIQFMAYSPLGYGEFARPDEVKVLDNPVLKDIAERNNKTVAQVCLQWTVQRGVATMPMSLKANELEENLTVGTWALSDEDMATITSLDQNHHYLDPKLWYGLPLWK